MLVSTCLCSRVLKHKLSENLYQLHFRSKSSCFLSFPFSQAYLEEKKLFHGDIAARNVLLHHNFTAKLCGLGLAYETHTRGASAVTRKVPVKWQAPERLLSKPPTIKADMYGFILGLEVHLSVRPVSFTPLCIISYPEVHRKEDNAPLLQLILSHVCRPCLVVFMHLSQQTTLLCFLFFFFFFFADGLLEFSCMK